jgi:hypothetical protein
MTRGRLYDDEPTVGPERPLWCAQFCPQGGPADVVEDMVGDDEVVQTRRQLDLRCRADDEVHVAEGLQASPGLSEPRR